MRVVNNLNEFIKKLFSDTENSLIKEIKKKIKNNININETDEIEIESKLREILDEVFKNTCTKSTEIEKFIEKYRDLLNLKDVLLLAGRHTKLSTTFRIKYYEHLCKNYDIITKQKIDKKYIEFLILKENFEYLEELKKQKGNKKIISNETYEYLVNLLEIM